MSSSYLFSLLFLPPNYFRNLFLLYFVGFLLLLFCFYSHSPQTFGLINEWPLLSFGKQFPFCTQSFRYLRIVHFWIILRHFASLSSGPHHEGIHWPFNMVVMMNGVVISVVAVIAACPIVAAVVVIVAVADVSIV